MPNNKKLITQPRGGTAKRKTKVNANGVLMNTLPKNIKKNYLNNSDTAYKIFLEVWQDLKSRSLNFKSIFELVIIYALEVASYFYTSKMIAEKGHIEYNDRNVPMVSPWVKIQRQNLSEITKLAYRLGIDPNTRTGMPAAPEPQEEKPTNRFGDTV